MAGSEVKQPWSCPTLIVLGRGTPEERMLGACRAYPVPGFSSSADTECFKLLTACSSCANESFS